MAKTQAAHNGTAELAATAKSPVDSLPFFHTGFAHPSAGDAKGYTDEKTGRITKSLANVILTMGYKDRPSDVVLIGAAVKASVDKGVTTVAVVFPTMKRGTSQVIQTESLATKEAFAALKSEILAAFKVWWPQNKGGVKASAISAGNGAMTADALGIDLS